MVTVTICAAAFYCRCFVAVYYVEYNVSACCYQISKVWRGSVCDRHSLCLAPAPVLQ